MRIKANPANNPLKGKPARKRISTLEPLEERIAPAVIASVNGSGVLTVTLQSGGDTAGLTVVSPHNIQVSGSGFTTVTETGVTAISVVYEASTQAVTATGSFAATTTTGNFNVQNLGAGFTGDAFTEATGSAGGNTFDFSSLTGALSFTNNGTLKDTISATKSGGFNLSGTLLTDTVGGDAMSLSIVGGVGTAILTDRVLMGGNTFTIGSTWVGTAQLLAQANDTVTVTKAGGFNLSNTSLTDTVGGTGDGMSLTLAHITTANLTDSSAAGGNSFTVSGWTGFGTLTANGSGADTVVASKTTAGSTFTLTNSLLQSGDGMSLTLAGTGGFHTANLTDGSTTGADTFTVSGWTGQGTLTANGSGADIVVASKTTAGSTFTLTNSLLQSGDGMSLTLAGTGGFHTANLTDGSTTGADTFTVSGWTGQGTLTANGSGADTVVASKTTAGSTFTLTNSLLQTGDGMSLTLAGTGGFHTANLTDGSTTGADTFTVSGWTGQGTLTANGSGADTVVASKTTASSTFTLTNSLLQSGDGMSLTLAGTGGFATANLTDGSTTGADTFTVSGWTGHGTLTANGSGADTVAATKTTAGSTFTLTNSLLQTGDGMSLTLAGTSGFATANLTDASMTGADTFTVSGWGHNGTLSGLSTDTVVASKPSGFVLTNTSLTNPPGTLNLTLSGIGIANLTDSSVGGGNSFTVSAWTGAGTLTNNGTAVDTVAASKNAGFTIASTSLAATDGMSLALAGNIGPIDVTTGSTSGLVVNVLSVGSTETVNIVGTNSSTVNIGSSGGAGTTANILGQVNVSNPPAFTTINVHDENDSVARTATLSVSGATATLSGLSPVAITYQIFDAASVAIFAGSGGDIFNVGGEGGVPVTITGGAGNDVFNLSFAGEAGGLGNLNAGITVHGSGGTNTVNLFDSDANVADSYTITNSTVSGGSSGFAGLNYDGIAALNLTDASGGHSIVVSDYTGTGTLTNGGTAADTVVASKAASFTLTDTSLTAGDGMSLTLASNVTIANLTDMGGGHSITVSGWTGTGTLTGTSTSTVVAAKAGSFTLTDTSLTDSFDGMSLTLSTIGVANLTDDSLGGGNSFTASGWSGAGTLASTGTATDTVVVSKNASFTLTNTLLTDSVDSMSLTLSGIGIADLTDTAGGQSFTVGGWTGSGALTDGGGAADTVVASKNASYTLADTLLTSSDNMSLTLSGSITTANLTDTGGGNSFTVSGWTHLGTLTGTSPDTIVASKGGGFTLTDTSLSDAADSMSLTLSTIGIANLTDFVGNQSFTVGGWTGSGTLTVGGTLADTVIASKNASFTLTNTLLTSSDDMSLTLAGSFTTANLTDTAGGHSFTVTGWTGGGTLTDSGTADTVIASKNASFTLTNTLLSSSDSMSLTLSGPITTANLTDTGAFHSFDVGGWTYGGSLSGSSTDTVIASKAASFTLSNTALSSSDSMSLTLSNIGAADLTDTAGSASFTVSDWTGGGSLTDTGGTGDTVIASKSASFTLADSSLSSSDGMDLSLSGFDAANLTDRGGHNSFTVSGWTGGGALTGFAPDTVVAVKSGGFTLTNTSLTDSVDRLSLSLDTIGYADLTDTLGGQTFTVSGWTGGGSLTDSTSSPAIPDTVAASKSASYTLTNSALSSSDEMSLALSGITTADLTDTGGHNSFTVSDWAHGGTLTGTSTDSVVASKSASYTLTNTSLTDTADAMSLTLSTIGLADLTDSGGAHSFTIGGWTGGGALMNDGSPDTLIAAKSASYTLANNSVSSSDGMSLVLTEGITLGLIGFNAADLTDTGGGHSFTVGGWTGGGVLTNSGEVADTVIAAKSASFTLANTSFSSSDGMSLTLAGSGGITTANLTDTGLVFILNDLTSGGGESFTVSGWTHKGSLTGVIGDVVVAAKNVSSFILSDGALATTDGMALSLSNVGVADLSVATPTFGPTIFNAIGYSGTLTATGGAPTPKTAGLRPLGNIFYGGKGINTLIGGTDQDRYVLQGLASESDTLVEPASDSFFTFNGYNEIGNAIDYSHMTTPTETIGGVKIGVSVNLNDISTTGVTQVFDPALSISNPAKGEPGTLTLIGNPGSFDELAGSPFKDTLIANDASSPEFTGNTAAIKTLKNLVTLIYSGGDTTGEDSITTGHGGAYVIYGKHGTLTEAVPGIVYQLPKTVPYFASSPSETPGTMIDSKTPVQYTDNFGNIVRITLSGPGTVTASYDTLTDDPDSLTVMGTNSKSVLSVKILGTLGEVTVGSIGFTDNSGIGGIDLGPGVSLGNGTGTPDALDVTGAVGSLTVGGINPGSTLTASSFGNITSTGAIESGSTITTPGKIGNITVKLTNASGVADAIDGLTVSALSIGNIYASVSGAPGALTQAVALLDSGFTTAGGNIGNITGAVSGLAVNAGKPAPQLLLAAGVGIADTGFSAAGNIGTITATASGALPVILKPFFAGGLSGIDDSEFEATGNIGAVHTAETATGSGIKPVFSGVVDSLIQAGGSVASVSVSGNLIDSDIFAGADLGVKGKTLIKTPTTNAGLSTISIGAITITGSVIGDTPGAYAIAATGDIGAVTVDGNMTGYAIAAGLDGVTDTANDNGRIASVIVKGQYANTSIVAGVESNTSSSSATPYTWGSLSDNQGISLAGVTQTSKIGAIILGALTVPNTVTSSVVTGDTIVHDSAIEAMALVSVKIGKLTADASFATAGYINENGGAESAVDTLVRAGSLS